MSRVGSHADLVVVELWIGWAPWMVGVRRVSQRRRGRLWMMMAVVVLVAEWQEQASWLTSMLLLLLQH